MWRSISEKFSSGTIWILAILFLTVSCSQPKDELLSILETGSEEFQSILDNPSHEIQIVYGKIGEDGIEHLTYNVYGNKFYYPASTVKMPTAFAAIQKLSEVGRSMDAQIVIDSSEHNPRNLVYDSLYQGPITVRNLVTKIFAFSDNQAYNLLYGWLGKDYLNGLNHQLGLTDSRIIHQLSESAFSFTDESNRNSFNVRLVEGGDTIVFEAEPNSFESTLNPATQVRGKAYMNSDGEIINEPFDFSSKNFFALEDMLGCLERVVKPELFEESERYAFDDNTYDQLAEIMTMRPNGLPAPKDTLPANYVKFFMYGDQENGDYPEHIDIRNKVGWAYGYLTDVAYIKDREKNVEFFLAATIHVNENETYNDGNYEYEEKGLPFLAELGRLIYDYESKAN